MAAPRGRRTASVQTILLAAAAAALLAAAPAPATAQAAKAAVQKPTLGAPCGPNNDGVWVKPDKSQLAASGGGAVGADGCIAADTQSATPFVRASLAPTVYTLVDVYMAASGSSAKHNATIYFGDVDLAKWPHIPRSKVLKNEGACASLPLGGEARVTCDFSWKGAGSTGSFLSVVAPGAKVCGLMLCVKEQLFSERGDPLSPTAAALYNTVVAARRASAAAAGAAGAAAIAPAWGEYPGTCEAYPLYPACAKDEECISSYNPGDGSCACWHCSAFTHNYECNPGDVLVVKHSCCFTCPDQPICAVCKKKAAAP